jgi:hypothetical protein
MSVQYEDDVYTHETGMADPLEDLAGVAVGAINALLNLG